MTAKTKTKPEAEKTPVDTTNGNANGNGHPENPMILRSREIAKNLQAEVDALKAHREQLVQGVAEIDEQLRALRVSIGAEEVAEEATTPTPRATRRGRPAGTGGGGRSGRQLEGWVFDAIKKAGAKGLTQIGAAEAVKKAGFQTTASDEDFGKSCYVSGINKLLKKEWVEHFKIPNERAGRYRLTKKAPAEWTR